MTTTTETGHHLKARVRRSLPTLPLEQIRIASPCHVSWSSMDGDERSRHCGQCQKTVHDLSKMTRAQAEALVNAAGPAPCVRLWVRKDGTVLTQDCPVGLEKVRRHLRRIGAALGALLAFLGLGGCTRNEPKPMQGEVKTPAHASNPAQGQAAAVGTSDAIIDRGECLMGKMAAPHQDAAGPAPIESAH